VDQHVRLAQQRCGSERQVNCGTVLLRILSTHLRGIGSNRSGGDCNVNKTRGADRENVHHARDCACLAIFFIGTPPTLAVPQDQDREQQLQEVIVTGSAFVTQGGAKDVNYLRGEVEQSRIPHPETFTAEGLISEHSVVIESNQPCAQVFCLVAESIDANLIAQPEARYLIGLGFTTNVQSQGWRREPLNLVAVVDKSGSMSGGPLALVRSSLLEVLGHLRDGDRLSIVLYGDRAHVHLEPIDVTAENRGIIRERIKEIVSAGSTAMEAGLQLGYEVARRCSAPNLGSCGALLPPAGKACAR
jgi:Ca-activated chloride channel family protein